MEKDLFTRVDESNTETPRVCHIIALRLAQFGLIVPEDVEKAVLDSAERGKDVLKNLMEEVNNGAKNEGKGEYTTRENFLRLASQIAFSFGIEGPEFCRERLNRLQLALYAYEISEEGVGFTE